VSDDLTARREAEALRVWRADGKAPSGICPHCGSPISVVQRGGWFRARCSHRHCGASGSKMRKLTRAVETFCRPDAYVLRHMGVVTMLEQERDELRAEVERLRAEVEGQGTGLTALQLILGPTPNGLIAAVKALADHAKHGTCLQVIPGTFIACGEGKNFCTRACWLESLLREAHRELSTIEAITVSPSDTDGLIDLVRRIGEAIN
jgi:hypothetical protein